jgi:hypothetical protein
MATEGSGNVGEIFVKATVVVDAEEARKAGSRAGQVASEAAQIRLQAAEARLGGGRPAEQAIYLAQGGNPNLGANQTLGFLTRGTHMQAGAGERVDRSFDAAQFASFRADERTSQRAMIDADRRQMRWAVGSFRAARSEMDASERASVRADAALSSYSDPFDLSSGVRDANRKGAAAMAVEESDAAKRRRGMGARLNELGQTQVMGTGMLMQLMFGGWEAATAMRNSAVSNATSGGMRPLDRLGAENQLVNQLQSGPMGSIVGQFLDPMGYRTASLGATHRAGTHAQTNEQAMVGLTETVRLAQAGGRLAGMRGTSQRIAAEELAVTKVESENRIALQERRRAHEDQAQAMSASIETEFRANAIGDILGGAASMNFAQNIRGAKNFWSGQADYSSAYKMRDMLNKQAAIDYAKLNDQARENAAREIEAIKSDSRAESMGRMAGVLGNSFVSQREGRMQARLAGTVHQDGIFALQREAIQQQQSQRFAEVMATPGMTMMQRLGIASREMEPFNAQTAGVNRAQRDFDQDRQMKRAEFYSDWREQARQTNRESFGLESTGRQLDFILQGRRGAQFGVESAQAQGIVDAALLGLDGAKSAKDRNQILSNARTELAILGAQGTLFNTPGTPSFFVGGAAPAFNPQPFINQLQNPVPPGQSNLPTGAQMDQIIGFLSRIIG